MDDKNTEDYEVGYGKPPRETRFAKGHSGNLRGRPRGAKNLETIVSKVGKRRVKVTGKHGTRSMLAIEAMVYQLSVQALSGDIRAIREYLQLHRQVAESDQATLLAPVFHERDHVVLEGIRQKNTAGKRFGIDCANRCYCTSTTARGEIEMSALSHAEYEFILQRDFMSFVERSFCELNPQTEFFRGFHIEAMAAKLEACRLGRIRRLIINLPPRSLKSHCVSVAFPGWLLGHDPSIQIICASYGQDLADKHARDSRTLMASSFYKRLFPATRLSLERQAVNDFLTTTQGFRMATSVGGVLTGRGSDFIIIDDPQKPDEALSETRRKSVNDWYDNTLLSRLNSKETGVIVIVMQRLHEDDLVGHVLEQGRWEVLSLPAIAEKDETHVLQSPLGRRVVTRKQGEALQPERESKATLIGVRETIGSYNFASQYQQSPVPLGGAMVKTDWLKYYEPSDLPERFSSVIQSWDTANKSGELNDYSVCTTWGVYDRRYYLLDVLRMRLNYPALKRAVGEQARRHKPNRIVIEDKASGTQLIQDLKNDGIFGIEPFEPPPHCDKIVRLHAQTAEFERGGVLLPRFAPWLADYVRELTSFPGSKYDDQVDSTTQALEYLCGFSLDVWVKLAQD